VRPIALAFATVLAGCRARSSDTGDTAPIGKDPGVGLETKATDAGGRAGVPGTLAEHRVLRPPARWATWPVPNFASSGLPNPQSYDLKVAGTVLDQVTGLMWQRRVDPGNVTFDEANAKCDSLELGGYRDWRLPSRIELVSILDLAETQPSIDRDAFPATPSDWFWSSSVGSDGPTTAWYVYFYFGYPKTDERSSPFRARCVRTEKPTAFEGDAEAHYELSATSVRDLGTGLTWQRVLSPSKLPFAAALAYCGHLNLEGHKDWRLPSMPELESLVDERASNPAIDTTAFPGTPAESFWTSSLFGNKPAEAWHVYFDHGAALYGLLKASFRVRCVR
jgi:Protein of unknown function (DUF1566)